MRMGLAVCPGGRGLNRPDLGRARRLLSCGQMQDLPLIIGVDEAGRGPWAGPVTAAAVILDPLRPIEGLTDSKKLTETARDRLAPLIRERAQAWCVAEASVEEIDALNIRQATFLAMRRAIFGQSRTLSDTSGLLGAAGRTRRVILIDGNALPDDLPAPARAIIKGDLTEPAISAASILAKTHRDAQMASLCKLYPGYGFSGHKGYGTSAHAAALARLGPCPVHRRSFAPVKALLRPC